MGLHSCDGVQDVAGQSDMSQPHHWSLLITLGMGNTAKLGNSNCCKGF